MSTAAEQTPELPRGTDTVVEDPYDFAVRFRQNLPGIFGNPREVLIDDVRHENFGENFFTPDAMRSAAGNVFADGNNTLTRKIEVSEHFDSYYDGHVTTAKRDGVLMATRTVYKHRAGKVRSFDPVPVETIGLYGFSFLTDSDQAWGLELTKYRTNRGEVFVYNFLEGRDTRALTITEGEFADKAVVTPSHITETGREPKHRQIYIGRLPLQGEEQSVFARILGIKPPRRRPLAFFPYARR